MSYLDSDPYYTANLELSEISDDTMTCAGVLACDLKPIGDALLSPGDPSPLGRTEDGDLAYPVFPDKTYLSLTRKECAKLAALLARSLGHRTLPQYGPDLSEDDYLLVCLIEEALPEVLYDETNHRRAKRLSEIACILEDRLEDMDLFSGAR